MPAKLLPDFLDDGDTVVLRVEDNEDTVGEYMYLHHAQIEIILVILSEINSYFYSNIILIKENIIYGNITLKHSKHHSSNSTLQITHVLFEVFGA